MDNGGAFTDRLLNGIDIQPGWTALDVGCGRGDVTFRLAERVGASGQVVGIDPNAGALATARDRAAKLRLNHVTFVEASIDSLPDAGSYDIVTCRRVLMYLPKRVAALRAMLKALKPGGALVIQEHDGGTTAGLERMPINANANRLIWETVKAEGAEVELGLKLHGLLSDAGFMDIDMSAEPLLQTPNQSVPTARIVAALADRIVRSGTASRAELDAFGLETLEARLSEERRTAGTTFFAETIFGAIARKPEC